MANELEKIGEDILHGVEEPFKFIGKTVKVLETAIKDQPVLKADLAALVTQVKAIAEGATVDLAAKGLDPVTDLTTLQQLESLFLFIKNTLVPEIETIYEQVKEDVTSTTAPATP
jgi:hypothetical protein